MGCTHSSEAVVADAAGPGTAGARDRRGSRLSNAIRSSAIVRSLLRRVSQPIGYQDHLFKPLEPADDGQSLITGQSQLKVCYRSLLRCCN